MKIKTENTSKQTIQGPTSFELYAMETELWTMENYKSKQPLTHRGPFSFQIRWTSTVQIKGMYVELSEWKGK